jgi:hypothetical protein
LGDEAAVQAGTLTDALAGIRIQENSGGTLSWAFSLQNTDAAKTKALLDAFAAGLPQTAVRDLELKKDSRTDIGVDEAAVERGTQQTEGWTLSWVRSKQSDRQLAAAERGSRTILSNDAALLERMIAETVPSNTPNASAKPASQQAGGRLDSRTLARAAAETLPLFRRDPQSLAWRLLNAAGEARFSLTAQADADLIVWQTGVAQ